MSETNPVYVNTFLVNNNLLANPSTGAFGSSGTRLMLSTGTTTNTPYALGMNTNMMWYGVPSGASHVFYGGNNGTTELLRVGPSSVTTPLFNCPGTIVQMQYTSTIASVNTNSTSPYSPITNLSLAFTPKFTTSRLIVMAHVYFNFNTSNNGVRFIIGNNGSTPPQLPSAGSDTLYYHSTSTDIHLKPVVSKQFNPPLASTVNIQVFYASYNGATITINPGSGNWGNSDLFVFEVAQ